MGNRILFVDDEKSILKALQRLFIDSDYDIFTAESGEEGLRILEEEVVDIVVSDMRMPGMNGRQFLKKVKGLYPETTRLILSGYANENEILDSIIDGTNSLYLFKPWDNEDIKKKMSQILEARNLYKNVALLDLVNGLDNLSFITGIYTTVCRKIEEEAEISAIAKVIETDPAVAVAVLRIINSSFYNIKTASVSQAITLLGLTVVKAIVLSCSLINFDGIKVPPFNITKLTRQSCLANSFMTQIYYELLKKKIPDNLATAGLLHNFGLAMCLHYFPEKYKGILGTYMLEGEEQSFTSLEKKEIGATHVELGGYLLDFWGIPYPVVECVLFQYEPLHSAVMDKEAVCAIHIAIYYAWKSVMPSFAGTLDLRVFPTLGISQSDCEKLLARITIN